MTGRIRVVPDSLNEAGRAVTGHSLALREATERAHRILQNVARDMEGEALEALLPKIRQVPQLGLALSDSVNELGRRLERMAQTFRDADRRAEQDVASIPWKIVASPGAKTGHGSLAAVAPLAGVAVTLGSHLSGSRGPMPQPRPAPTPTPVPSQSRSVEGSAPAPCPVPVPAPTPVAPTAANRRVYQVTLDNAGDDGASTFLVDAPDPPVRTSRRPAPHEWESATQSTPARTPRPATAQSALGSNVPDLELAAARPGEDGSIAKVHPVGREPRVHDGVANFFVNGVDNTYLGARNNAQLMANELQESVQLVYSECGEQSDVPFGVLLDLAHAPLNRIGVETNASRVLASDIISQLETGRGARVFAHSRGGAVAYNAVQIVSEQFVNSGRSSMLEHLEVVTLGGYSPQADMWPYGPRITTIENARDVVPTIPGGGSQPLNPNLADWVQYKRYHPLEIYLPVVKAVMKR